MRLQYRLNMYMYCTCIVPFTTGTRTSAHIYLNILRLSSFIACLSKTATDGVPVESGVTSTCLAIWNVLERESEPRSATIASSESDFRGMVISGAWMETSSFIRCPLAWVSWTWTESTDHKYLQVISGQMLSLNFTTAFGIGVEPMALM